MPTSILKINGTPIDRDEADVTIERLLAGVPDGPTQLLFTHYGRTSQAYPHRSLVELTIDDAPAFKGRVVGVEQSGADWAYTAHGGSYLMDLVAVTHPRHGTGYPGLVYNAPPDDPDYDAGLVGLEIGEILAAILTVDPIASDLWRNGVEAYEAAPLDPAIGYDTLGGDPPVLKAATLTDFGLMTTVPLSAVRFEGHHLWTQITGFIGEFAPTYRFRIFPDGTIRCNDTRTLTPRVLTIGTDPIRVPDFSRDTSRCASALRIRGKSMVEPWWFTLAEGDLVEDWTLQEELDWTWADFTNPEGGYSSGTIDAMGTNTVTVDPDDGLQEWPLNYWAGLMAYVTLIDDAASGNITYQLMRRVIANTAAGATSVLTVDVDLPPAPEYDRYELVGVAGGSHVHRRYKFADDRQDAARRIVNRFPYPVATASLGTGFDGATVTSVPFGWNVKSSAGLFTGQVFPLQFSLFSDGGVVKIMTAEPTIKPWTEPADRDIGGDAVTKPDDVRVLVPVSKGPLEVRVPAADAVPPWEGRAYEIHGLEYEQVIDLDNWNYLGDLAIAEQFAQDLLDSLKDPVISGTIEYVGFDADAFAAGGIESIKLAAVDEFDAIDDDLDDVPLPVHSVEFRWHHAPGGATTHTTAISVSNRAFPAHGERNNEPRGYAGGGLFGFEDIAKSMGLFTGEGG